MALPIALFGVAIATPPAWASPPDQVAPPTAVAGAGQIEVTFTPPFDGGVTPVTYTAACTSSDSGTPGSQDGSDSPITVGALDNGKTYTCTVVAHNADGDSVESDPSVAVVPSTVPDQPAQPTSAPGDQEIDVSFAAPFDGGSTITGFGYTAECTPTVGSPVSQSGAASPITVTGLTNGTTYTCTVVAHNANGDSPVSPASASAVPSTVPDTPAAPTLTRGNTQIDVAFTAPGDGGKPPITGYTAECTPTVGSPVTQPGTASPITVTGLTNGTAYTCTVFATNGNGDGLPSLPSLSVVPATVPNQPAPPSVAGGDHQIVVSFPAPGNGGSAITGYSTTCTPTAGSPVTQPGAASPITVTGLTNGTGYTCKLTATNDVGPSTESNASASVKPGTSPNAPTNVIARPAPTSLATGALIVTYTPGPANGGAITRYDATCTSNNGGVTKTAHVVAGAIAVPALTTAKKYTCRVTATNANGTSPASVASATATVGAPAAPTIRQVRSLPHGLAIAFSRNANNGSPITSYRARCTSSNGGFPGNPLQTVSPIIVSNLTVGATYTCAVTAINLRGESRIAPTASEIPGTAFKATSCHSTSGSISATHGLFLRTKKPQNLNLAATMSSCTGSGTYVTAGLVRVAFRSSTAISCDSAITVTNGGSGTFTWTAPSGMGTAGATLRLVFASSSGHTTTAHFYGTVTSKANLFTQHHVSGNLTLNRGLRSVARGGDCTATKPLTSFGITNFNFSIT